jgi:hypothetical protein
MRIVSEQAFFKNCHQRFCDGIEKIVYTHSVVHNWLPTTARSSLQNCNAFQQ